MERIERTEDDVGTIEPGSYDGGDEELRAVGVLASVSHGEDTGLRVLELEVLIYATPISTLCPTPENRVRFLSEKVHSPSNFSP